MKRKPRLPTVTEMRRDLESRRLKRKLGKATQRALKAEARTQDLLEAISRLMDKVEECREGLGKALKGYTGK